MTDESPEFEDEHARMQRLVFSAVAHDLKTPLACIIGSLEALNHMKEKISPKQRDTLINVALGQAHRLDLLFTRMLDEAAPK